MIPKAVLEKIEAEFTGDTLSAKMAKSAAQWGYQLATDGREELEKENASLRETLSCFHWGTVHDTITALQSSITKLENMTVDEFIEMKMLKMSKL